MKEIVQGKLKRVIITFTILVLSFLGITGIGYLIEVELLNEAEYTYLDYLLYLLGYGSIDNSNIWFKIVFSICSLFVLTLFSSACTVTWLESRRTLKIGEKIIVGKNNNGDYTANISLKSRAQSIYGATINVIINVGTESFAEEVNIAYIPKRKHRFAPFNIGLNSVVYKHFKEVLEGRLDDAELIVSVVYSDVLSGEGYTVFKRYIYNPDEKESDFVFLPDPNDYFDRSFKNDNTIKTEFEEFILSKQLNVDFSNAQIIDCRSPERYKPEPQNQFKVEFAKEKSYNDGDFQMLCIPIDISEDWGIYYDMCAHLYIELENINDIDVFIEIKKDDGRAVILTENNKLSSSNKALDIDMTRYRKHTWENIKEICFTVFHSHVREKNKNAEFTVKECSFRIK